MEKIKKVCYRPHRGSLIESMKEKKTFNNVAQLIKFLSNGKQHQFEFYTYDDRIKANTYIVTENKSPIGFFWYIESKK
jgi:hypothetical protein